jgi:hypothetical protein
LIFKYEGEIVYEATLFTDFLKLQSEWFYNHLSGETFSKANECTFDIDHPKTGEDFVHFLNGKIKSWKRIESLKILLDFVLLTL